MTSAAPSKRHLKRRLDDYLWGDTSLPLLRLRQQLKETFMPIGPTVVLGGLVRDIARSGARGFRSDVDLVIDASPKTVAAIAREMGAVRNRFGGFSYLFPLWKIDFWALRSTWAHEEGHISIRSLRDIIRCTFFTTDAIAYHLQNRELIADQRYLDHIWLRVLEINLRPNPSLKGNLTRAVRRSLAHNLTLGPKLKEFVSSLMTHDSFNYIVSTERKLYGDSYAEPYGTADRLLEALLYKPSRLTFAHGRAEQYWLPLDYAKTVS